MTARPTAPHQDTWRVTLTLADAAHVAPFEAVLEGLGGAVSSFEIDGGPAWRLVAHCGAIRDRMALSRSIADAAAQLGIDPPRLAVERLPATDWAARYRRDTPPVTIGRFFVRPGHFDGPTPDGLAAIRLDAGLAFGTGEHASTRGCLLALERLHDAGHVVRDVLDLGCGSAILAIAAAILWPGAMIVAADNDAAAMRTARDNVAENGASGAVRVIESDGYSADALAGRRFDLIAANILAGPLIALAPATAAHLAPDGVVVLSGLLAAQAEAVAAAHVAAGLKPTGRQDIGEWTTLVLTRPG